MLIYISMPEPDLFGDSLIEQTLKQSFDDLRNENRSLTTKLSELSSENSRLSALCERISRESAELDLMLVDQRQVNDYLACQLSLVQKELLGKFSSSLPDNKALRSLIDKQAELISRQIELELKYLN